jgi:ketosteroid isomerase-like protein
MQRSKLLLVLTCVAVVACSQGLTSREALIEGRTVEERITTWVRAMNNAKVDSVVLMYDASADVHAVWADGHIAEGFEAVEQRWGDFYAQTNYMNVAMSQLRVEVLAPGVAQAVFRHSTDIVDGGGQRAVFPGRALVVLLKDPADNLWKIHTQLFSVNRQSEN